MADGIDVTPGSGKKVDTDEVTRGGVTVHQQVIKLSLGADNATDCLVDSGQQASANSLPVVLPSDCEFIKAEDAAHSSGDKGIMLLGVRNDAAAARSGADAGYTPLATDSAGRAEVTTRSTIVTVTPTLGVAGAYVAGDVVGIAHEVALAFTAQKLSGYLTNLTLIDKAKQNAALTVFLFAVSPTLVNADNGVFDITDANLATATPLGLVNINPGDYASTNSNSVASVDCSKLLKSGTTSFFFAILNNGTPTYAAGDLILSFHVAQD